MNPENRGYYLRNRGPAEPLDENRDTVLHRSEQPLVDLQPLANPQEQDQPPREPTPPPPADPVDIEVIEPVAMMQATGLQLEKFAGDDSVDAKSWLKWFDNYSKFHKQDEGQQLLTLPFYLTSHARIWYEALSDETKTDLGGLKTAFEARFKKQDILDTELLDMTQRPDECCNDYFSRVLKKSQQSTADKSLVTSLAVKGLRPAIKQIVMPQSPTDFDDARQKAILAEKTVLATTTPVAAYIQSNSSDRKVDELTQMVKELRTQVDQQQTQKSQNQQQQQQQYHNERRGGRRGNWRGRSRHQHNREWRKPPAWQQQQQSSWDQQPAAQPWQQQNPDQGPPRRNDQQRRNCTGCRGPFSNLSMLSTLLWSLILLCCLMGDVNGVSV